MAVTTYLERSEGQEHKFYEVTVDGADLTIRYGRIGTDGQTQRKTLPDSAQAQAEADKKLAEKRKKGYADAVKGQTAKKSVAETAAALPKALEAYREQIESTIKPAVRLTLKGLPEHAWESKVGGVPYRPRGQDWPVNPDGNPLIFLAQVNFADIPQLPDFPHSGILQFFIGPDDLYGLEIGNFQQNVQQRSFRVLYHENTVQETLQLDNTIPYDLNDLISPFDDTVNWRMHGERVDWPITQSDRLFETITGLDFWNDDKWPGDKGMEMAEKYGSYAQGGHPGDGGHQLGGYPTFTQADPRDEDSDLILLFQLDSETEKGIMWGDVGIANFFISPDDLRKKDFSRVLYNWDCG